MCLIIDIVVFICGVLSGYLVNILVNVILKEIDSMSICSVCKVKTRWHDRIPVISFLLLKGRCRSCGAKVSRRYPIVEIANGVLYVIVFMANGLNLLSICYCLMTSAFLVISIVDWLTYEIPLPCNAYLGGIGIIVCVLDFSNIAEHLIGAIAVSGVLYLLFVVSKGAAIGGGDVKLMAVGGLILGWKLGILAFLFGCIIGAICHVIRMKIVKADRVLAMGPYLSIGLYCCALWGNDFLNWYFRSMTI